VDDNDNGPSSPQTPRRGSNAFSPRQQFSKIKERLWQRRQQQNAPNEEGSGDMLQSATVENAAYEETYQYDDIKNDYNSHLYNADDDDDDDDGAHGFLTAVSSSSDKHQRAHKKPMRESARHHDGARHAHHSETPLPLSPLKSPAVLRDLDTPLPASPTMEATLWDLLAENNPTSDV